MHRLLYSVLSIPFTTVPLTGAAPPLEFAQVNPTAALFGKVLPLANGQTLLLARPSAVTLAERSGSFSLFPGSPFEFFTDGDSGLTLLDATGTVVPNTFTLGSGTTFTSDAAVDDGGNIWLAGETTSDDFPLVAPLFTKKIDYASTAFAVKMDPASR